MDDDQDNPFAHDPELTAKLKAAGHELVMTLGRWRGLDGLAWDALGESLVVRFRAGPVHRPAIPVSWEIPHALARDLLAQLGQAVAERDCAAPTKQ
jgi:hypothetical protein